MTEQTVAGHHRALLRRCRHRHEGGRTIASRARPEERPMNISQLGALRGVRHDQPRAQRPERQPATIRATDSTTPPRHEQFRSGHTVNGLSRERGPERRLARRRGAGVDHHIGSGTLDSGTLDSGTLDQAHWIRTLDFRQWTQHIGSAIGSGHWTQAHWTQHIGPASHPAPAPAFQATRP